MEKFISSDGLYWPGVLKGIKKASNPLQPIFEVITNSFEAIDMRSKLNAPFEPTPAELCGWLHGGFMSSEL